MGISFLRNHPALSATWFISSALTSIFTLLPANKVENISLMYVIWCAVWCTKLICDSLLGGLLMVAVGVLYLIFEDRLLADFSSPKKTIALQKGNEISRTLIGVQVCVGVLL